MLSDLNERFGRSQIRLTSHNANPSDLQVYRPFFIAGVVSVLTVGCLLGAFALLGISMQANYTATDFTPYVLAHANSQLFGWVGFFVIGFSLQQCHVPEQMIRHFNRLAAMTLWTLAAGIVLRFAAEPLAGQNTQQWAWLGELSGVLQLIAVLVYLWLGGMYHRKTGALTWPTAFVFGSLLCLLVVTALDPFVFAETHQVAKLDSILFVARWFSPLREVQFLGFVAMMVFGVAATKFSSCLGFAPPNKVLGIAAFLAWTTGLLCRIFGWMSFFNAEMARGSDSLYRVGAALLFFGAVFMAASLKVFEPVLVKNRSQLFIRTAFVWLWIAGFLLILEPLHLTSIGAPFSHAYTGAIRHAVTVGFISQMIVGVGWHVATKMGRVDETRLVSLLPVWFLLNLGNTLRVALEIATDYGTGAFMPMGFTGFVELVGLAVWGALMIRLCGLKPELKHLGA